MINVRGQTSIEFLILLGFMLIVFTSFFAFTGKMVERNNQEIIRHSLITTGDKIIEEFSVANQVRDGYQRTFSLPRTVGEQTYSVQILQKQELVVNTSLLERVFFLPFNVTVNGADSGFLNVGGENTITKDDGDIDITFTG